MKNKQIQSSREGLLPDGWIKTKINVVADNVEKINPKKYPDTLYYYCDINSIDNSKLQITNPKQFLGRDAPSRARQLIKTNDILFATVRTYLKNIAIVSNELNAQLASTGFCVIRPKINYKFVFYYVQTKRFLNKLNKIQRGTNYPAVKNSDVMNSIILVPPPNEQKRIVSKIESIFTQIDTLEKSLKSIKSRMKRYKQAVLKLAFEGRLVPQDPNDESAKTLLKRLHHDVEIKTNTVQHKLPKGWAKTTLENTAVVLLGLSPPSSTYNYTKEGLPFFQGKADFGRVHPTTRVWCSQPKRIVEEDTLLLSVRAPIGSVNITTKKCSIGRGLAGIKPIGGMDTKFFFYFFHHIQMKLKTYGTGTTFMAIRGKEIRGCEINLPPLNEQKRIVCKIESIFAHVDVIDAYVARLLETLATLRQSVLKYAFDGKLVPQDPHDAPANNLLEKIRGANDV